MAGFDHIVVALGCAEGDASLIAYASLLAKLGGTTEVRFVHVAESKAPAAAVREQMRATVAAAFTGTARIACDVLNGPLTDRLLSYVTEFQADLILIGSKKHVLGARLAMVAPCSVAVIPSGHPAHLSHMMIAIDFSEAADNTLQWATSLAASDPSMRCTALHVMTHESPDLFAEHESEMEQAEAMRKTLARADRNGVTVAARLANTRPLHGVAQIILAEAAECGADCIAVSTRGRSASASILLGSVTEEVIERATIPLLVNKHAGASLGLAAILLGRAGWRAGVKTN